MERKTFKNIQQFGTSLFGAVLLSIALAVSPVGAEKKPGECGRVISKWDGKCWVLTCENSGRLIGRQCPGDGGSH